MNSNRQKNEAIYRKLKMELLKMYPTGQFIALDEGQIVADAASFDELTTALAAIDKNRADVFVIQVGAEYPEEVFILL